MKRLDHLKFNVKVQVIYYQTQSDDLGIEFAQSPKRITLNEAKDILDSRGLVYIQVNCKYCKGGNYNDKQNKSNIRLHF